MSTTLRLMFISAMLFGIIRPIVSQTVYIVRHAEKDLSSANPKDPSLNTFGLARAYDLKKRLKKIDLIAIYSTDYKRTRETAEPVAREKGLEIQIYDANHLDSFAIRLKRQFKGKHILVIGHSNTILETVKSFGGTAKKNHIGDLEYSNLFIVSINRKGSVRTKSTTYGQ